VVTSTLALYEARRNIAIKRPSWAVAFAALASSCEVVPSLDAAVPAAIAAKDRPILATALHSRCDLLVSGDRRHFGHLFGQAASGVSIVSPRDLAERLAREQ